MLNGNAGAAVACCRYGSGRSGYGVGDSNNGRISLAGLLTNRPGVRQGLMDTITKAIDNAVHGGNSGFMSGNGNAGSSGNGNGAGGANVIPFPMVNPFKPVVQTRVPIPGLTARPKFLYTVPPSPDDEQFAGLGSLGAFEPIGVGPGWDIIRNGGISLSSGPSKLETILGTIQATLPATVQAFRASPGNIFPGASENPFGTATVLRERGAGADIGATAGAAAGNVADSIGSIVQRHPYLVLGAGAALVLLFMNPPRRSR